MYQGYLILIKFIYKILHCIIQNPEFQPDVLLEYYTGHIYFTLFFLVQTQGIDTIIRLRTSAPNPNHFPDPSLSRPQGGIFFYKSLHILFV